jgi:transcriptional regulator with XRE-family HTH domain/tetratricopeptide (TPR) repeat protein
MQSGSSASSQADEHAELGSTGLRDSIDTRERRLPGTQGLASDHESSQDVAMDGEESYAALLRSARHAAGLTLEELSEASGVSVRALSDMERGRALGPQRRTVALIADALRLDDVRRERLLARAKAGRTRPSYLSAAPGLAELPDAIHDFTGRAAELGWITDLVDTIDRPTNRRGTAVISGGAGLGKTTLAIRAAHTLRDRFPDGTHFIEALGMRPRPVGSDEILARILRALGVRDAQIPSDPAERAARYRQILRERRILVIIDDAASEAQVRPLLPGAGDSHLLVTSRRLLAGLEGVARLHLDPLPTADATGLLKRILADTPSHEDLQRLVDVLGGLPLALRIAGNRLASRPQWSVGDLATRLAAAERRLDQLSAGDLTVAAAFGLSYEQLRDPTRRIFRRAALSAGADFGAALAAATGACTETAAEDELDELVDLGLLETAPHGRYRFHDLVRLYAIQRLDAEESPDDVTAARMRMVSWLLDTLAAAGDWFEPDGRTDGFTSADHADAWIRIEADHWLPALSTAADAGHHQTVVRAAGALHWFSDRWTHWPRWADVFTAGHDSAAQLGDTSLQAEFLNHTAWTHTIPGRDPRPALTLAGQAIALARSVGDRTQEAWALNYTAVAQRLLGQPQAALAAARAAADAFEQAGDPDAVCQILQTSADIAADLGDYDDALDSYQRARRLVEEPNGGMTPGIAAVSRPYVLANLARHLGRMDRIAEAIPMMREAAMLAAGQSNPLAQAAMLRALGTTLYSADHTTEAIDSLTEAAAIFDATDRPQEAADCRDRAAAIPTLPTRM